MSERTKRARLASEEREASEQVKRRELKKRAKRAKYWL